MKDLTWPSAILFLGVVAAIVILYGLTSDATIRSKLIDYFDSVVPFIVGATAGGAAGAAAGFAKGRNLL